MKIVNSKYLITIICPIASPLTEQSAFAAFLFVREKHGNFAEF
ncbi:MAG: hypothetical protein QXZ68_07820 [Candidatus Bathyarchaeia archaeon]